MTLGQFVATYHTEVSLVLGPVLVFCIFRWSPLPAWANVLIVLAAMYFAIGVWGIVLNAWALIALAVWLATKRRSGLRVLRYLTLGLAGLLLLAAVAFYLYLLFTEPGELFRSLGNPLLYLYAVPGVLMLILSQHIAIKIEQSSAPPSDIAGGAGHGSRVAPDK